VTVTLTKQEPRLQTLPNHGGTALWLLTVSAIVADAQGADSNIFVYQRSPQAGLGDRFAAVASASQLRDLPLASGSGSYYRYNLAVFLCRSAVELDATWVQLQSDVRLLVRDWDKLQTTQNAESVTITPNTVTPTSGWSPDSAPVTVRYSDDFSKMLLYNAAGQLIGEIPVLEPS